MAKIDLNTVKLRVSNVLNKQYYSSLNNTKYDNKNKLYGSSDDLQVLDSYGLDSNDTIYVLKNNNNIILAPSDDEALPIIGEFPGDSFLFNKLPPHIKAFFKSYAMDIEIHQKEEKLYSSLENTNIYGATVPTILDEWEDVLPLLEGRGPTNASMATYWGLGAVDFNGITNGNTESHILAVKKSAYNHNIIFKDPSTNLDVRVLAGCFAISGAQILIYWANKGKQIAGVQKFYKVGCTENIPSRTANSTISNNASYGYPNTKLILPMSELNSIETFDYINMRDSYYKYYSDPTLKNPDKWATNSDNSTNIKNKAVAKICRYLFQAIVRGTVSLSFSGGQNYHFNIYLKRYFNYMAAFLATSESLSNYSRDFLTNSDDNITLEEFLDSSLFRRGCFIDTVKTNCNRYTVLTHMLYKEISRQNPVRLAISGSGGHSIVCDGYRKSDKKFHLNFGWYNQCNGYYTMNLFNNNYKDEAPYMPDNYKYKGLLFRCYPNEYYNDDIDVNYNKITFTENGGTNSSIIVVAHSWNSTTKKLTYTNHDTWDIEGFTGTQYTPSNASWLTIKKEAVYNDKIILTATQNKTGNKKTYDLYVYRKNNPDLREKIVIEQDESTNPEVQEDTLVLSTRNLIFENTGGIKNVTVTAGPNANSWTALVTSGNWFTVSKTNSTTLKVTVSNSNPDIQIKTGTVKVTNNTKSETLTVKLDAAEPYLNIDKSALNFTNTGGTDTITVTSNLTWNYNIAEGIVSWIQISRNNNILTITTDANNSQDYRECTINIVPTDNTLSTLYKKEIIVNVAKTTVISEISTSVLEYKVNKDGYIIEVDGVSETIPGILDISINSNQEWEYSFDEETYGDFLVVVPGENLLTIVTDENPYAKTFSVPIYVYTKDNVATATITIYYAEPANPRLIVDESTRLLTAGQYIINIDTNTTWTYSYNSNLITVETNEFIEDDTLIVTVDQEVIRYFVRDAGVITITSTDNLTPLPIVKQIPIQIKSRIKYFYILDDPEHTNMYYVPSIGGTHIIYVSDSFDGNWEFDLQNFECDWITDIRRHPVYNAMVVDIKKNTDPGNKISDYIKIKSPEFEINEQGDTSVLYTSTRIYIYGYTGQEKYLQLDELILAYPNTGNVNNPDTVNITTNVTYTTSGTALTADWLSINITLNTDADDVITVVAQPNISLDEKTAVLTLKNTTYNLTAELNITIEAHEPFLTLGTEEYHFDNNGGTATIDVSTNLINPFIYDFLSNWLTTSLDSAYQHITLQATHIDKLEHSLLITITGLYHLDEDNDEYITKDLYVVMDAFLPSITLNPDTVTFDSEGGNTTVNVIHNGVTWNLVYTLPDWLTTTKTANTITLYALPNTTNVSKTCTIKVKDTESDYYQNLYVIIAGQEVIHNITVDTTVITFSSPGEYKTVNVTSDISWSINNNLPQWLTATVNNNVITLTNNNQTGSTQSTTLMIKSNDNSIIKTVRVISYYTDENTYIISRHGENAIITIYGKKNNNLINDKNKSLLYINSGSGYLDVTSSLEIRNYKVIYNFNMPENTGTTLIEYNILGKFIYDTDNNKVDSNILTFILEHAIFTPCMDINKTIFTYNDSTKVKIKFWVENENHEHIYNQSDVILELRPVSGQDTISYTATAITVNQSEHVLYQELTLNTNNTANTKYLTITVCHDKFRDIIIVKEIKQTPNS